MAFAINLCIKIKVMVLDTHVQCAQQKKIHSNLKNLYNFMSNLCAYPASSA